MEERYWPFDVLPPDQRTPLHQQQIDFLDAAHLKGFCPHTFGCNNFGASAGERTGYIIRRTRRFWELVLFAPSEGRLAAYVSGFEVNAEAVLRWLQGGQLANILELVRPHLVNVGGRSGGVRLESPQDAQA